MLYLLKARLAASLIRLSQYLVDQQPARPALLDTQREELRNSLVLTQESAAIQILLECCREEVGEGGRLRAVKETNSQVCCYLARMCQAFPPLIEDCIQLLAQAATMWISAQSVTQYHGAEYCMDLGRMLGPVLASGHSLTQEIVKTFDNILSETVLVNRM